MRQLRQQFRGGSFWPHAWRWPALAGPPDFDRRLSFGFYAFLLVCFGCFTWLGSISPELLGRLAIEDSLLENLTAVFYALTALLLLLTAAAERRWPLRVLYLLAAAVCGFIAGEEIDWGQRILGYATPALFLDFNSRDAVSVHNSRFQYLFNDLQRAVPLVGCLAAGAARACGKDKLLFVPLPTLPLLLGFLLVYSYWEPDGSLFKPGSLGNFSAVHWLQLEFGIASALLLLIALYALFARQTGLFLAAAAAAFSIDAMGYANLPEDVSNMMVKELYEYLVAAIVLFYALELLLASRRREPPDAAAAPLLPPARPRPIRLGRPWLALCALAIVSSLALYPWEDFKSGADRAAAREHWQLAVSGAAGRPLALENLRQAGADTGFEVYALGDRLIYAAQEREGQCSPEQHLFLHIYPANAGDLPAGRREYGYANRDFLFGWHRQFLGGGRCVAVVPLPDYPIAEFRTGQYRSHDGRAHWQTRQVVDFSAYRAAYAAATAGAPAVRAVFDVYLTEEALTYIKEDCTAADTAGTFILHPFPVHPADLPEWRQGAEFDNLDFGFARHGARFDGKCVAIAPLPDYPIDRLRVGQWLPQENRQLWSAEFPAQQ